MAQTLAFIIQTSSFIILIYAFGLRSQTTISEPAPAADAAACRHGTDSQRSHAHRDHRLDRGGGGGVAGIKAAGAASAPAGMVVRPHGAQRHRRYDGPRVVDGH